MQKKLRFQRPAQRATSQSSCLGSGEIEIDIRKDGVGKVMIGKSLIDEDEEEEESRKEKAGREENRKRLGKRRKVIPDNLIEFGKGGSLVVESRKQSLIGIAGPCKRSAHLLEEEG